jgi:protein-tyrosine-phosphatase
MMEVLLRQTAKTFGKELHVESAGTSSSIFEKQEGAAPDAVHEMSIWNLDLTAHHARNIGQVDLTSFDHILAVNAETRTALIDSGAPPHKIVVINEENGGVPNPWQRGKEAYRDCAKLLGAKLVEFTATL